MWCYSLAGHLLFIFSSIDIWIDHWSLVDLHVLIDDLLGDFWIVNQFVKASQLEPTIWICIKAFMKIRISLLAALTLILLQRPILSVFLRLANVVQALPKWSVIVEKHRFLLSLNRINGNFGEFSPLFWFFEYLNKFAIDHLIVDRFNCFFLPPHS